MEYDVLAAEYARHRQVHPEVLRRLLSVGGVRASTRVLEVGCGTGNYATALHRATGCACWGIDPSREMLTRARRNGGEVSLQQGTAEELGFAAGCFDLVFSVDVIHHVRDRVAYTQEAYRVLRSDGKLCTVTDSEEIIRHRRPLAVYFPETVDVELGRYPRIANLKALMREAGFDSPEDATVGFAYTLRDIQAFREKAFSSLHLISDRAFQDGIARMEADLRVGPIACESRYILVWGVKE